MAYIPIAEIPNAPGIQEMPLPEYQKIPSIRHAGVNMKVDMSGAARSLQQDALPGGFASGLARATASAGSGAMAMGKAISQGTGELGNAIGRAGYVLSKFAEKAVQQADELAGIKAQENRTIIEGKFEADTAGMTMAQKQEAWPQYHAQLVDLNSGLGTSRHTRDKIDAYDSAWGATQGSKIQTAAIKKSLQDNQDYINEKINHAIDAPSEENIQVARQANDVALNTEQINKARHEEVERKLDRAAKLGFIKEKASDPASARWIQEQSELQAQGKPNDLYTKDDDAAMWNHGDDVATKTISDNQNATLDSLHTRLINDPTTVTEAELKKQWQDGNLTTTQYEALEKARSSEPIVYNEANVGDAYSAANLYDSTKDKDAKGRQSMTKYNAVYQQILTTVPKEHQGPLIETLKKNFKDGTEGSQTAQASEKQLAISMVDKGWESNIIADPLTKLPMPSGMDKGKIERPEEYASSNARRVELHREIEEYVKAHPDFEANELTEHIWKKMRGIVHANVSSNISGIKVVEQFPSYGSSISMPGTPDLTGETKMPESRPLTPAEDKANADAAKAGLPLPTPAALQGHGAPVQITVYDKENRTFREAPLPATPELLRTVQQESKIYDMLLKSKGETLRGKLGILEADVLDPSIREGIVRDATMMSREKKISLEDAGDIVIKDLAAKAKADEAKIQTALKPLVSANQAVPTGFFQGKLAGQEATFVKTANKYGIDPALLMAISAHETGKGTSDMLKAKNNPGGLFDSKRDEYMTFNTVEEGIDAMASNLKRNYIDQGLTTIPQIQQKYAEVGAANDPKGQNKDWVDGVTKFHNQLKSATTAKGPTLSMGPVKVINAVDASLPAMSRPRTANINKIVVHGDVLTDVDKLVSVQKAEDRGYHYYIGLDGSVRMVVPPDKVAYHIKGANSDSIGIVIAGADNGQMPTAAQDKAAKQLISQLAKQYGIKQQDVMGHGERQPGRRDVREGGNVAKDTREHGFV